MSLDLEKENGEKFPEYRRFLKIRHQKRKKGDKQENGKEKKKLREDKKKNRKAQKRKGIEK